MPFIISVVAQGIFLKMGVLVIKEGWSFAYTLVIYEIFIAIFILIEKYTLRPELS